MKKWFQILTVLSLVVLTAACAPDRKKEKVGRTSRSGLNYDSNGRPIVSGSGSGLGDWNLLESGRAAVSGLNYQSSRASTISGHTVSKIEAIEGLISSFINIHNENEYRSAGSATGISFAAKLAMPSGNCQIDSANSLLGIVIFDDIAMDNDDLVIRILMSPSRGANASAQVSNGACAVTFSDEYGTITLVLQNSSTTISGEIYYRNNTSITNHQTTGNEVYLGSFSNVSRSGIIF